VQLQARKNLQFTYMYISSNYVKSNSISILISRCRYGNGIWNLNCQKQAFRTVLNTLTAAIALYKTSTSVCRHTVVWLWRNNNMIFGIILETRIHTVQ